MRIKFYNLFIDIYTTKIFLKELSEVFNGNSAKSLVFINAHCFNTSQKNKDYRNAVLASDYILNDGIGVKIGGILNNTKFPENLNGTDFIKN